MTMCLDDQYFTMTGSAVCFRTVREKFPKQVSYLRKTKWFPKLDNLHPFNSPLGRSTLIFE